MHERPAVGGRGTAGNGPGTGADASRRDFLRAAAGTGVAVGTLSGATTSGSALSPHTGPPEVVTVTAEGPYALHVEWSETVGPYRVSIRTDQYVWTSEFVDGTELTLEGPPVVPEQTYEVTVGVSWEQPRGWWPSDPVTVTTPSPADAAPSRPRGAEVAGKTATSLTLHWDYETGVGHDHFAIAYARYDGDALGTAVTTTRADRTGETTVTELSESETYLFWLWGVGVDGHRTGHRRFVAETGGDWTAPTAVSNLRTTGATEMSASFAWDAATDESEAGLDGYDVLLLDGDPPQDASAVVTERRVDPDTTATAFEDLDERSPYEVRVTAVDAAGNRSADRSVSFATVPDDGQGVLSTRLDVAGAAVSSEPNRASVSRGTWDHSVLIEGAIRTSTSCYEPVIADAAFDGVTLRVDVETEHSDETEVCVAAEELVEYEATVECSAPPDEVVVTHAGVDPWETTWEPEGGPTVPAPENLSVVETNPTSVGLSWDPVGEDVDLQRYAVYVDGEKSHAVGPSTSAGPVLGLSPDTTYEITVETVTTNGDRSEGRTVTVTTEPIDVPVVLSSSFVITAVDRPDDDPSHAATFSRRGRTVTVRGVVPVEAPVESLSVADVAVTDETLSLTVAASREWAGDLSIGTFVGLARYEAYFELSESVSTVEVAHSTATVGDWSATRTHNGVPVVDGVVPTDPDDDGVYEDLNVNYRTDSDDVVVYFENYDQPAMSGSPSFFDLNGNDRTDADDVVQLFESL